MRDDLTVPRRVQLRRVRGWRKPEGAITVARPSRWGNPFRVGDTAPDRQGAVEAYRRYLAERPDLCRQARTYLAGHDLACWCPLDEVCHGDVLLRVAAGGEP